MFLHRHHVSFQTTGQAALSVADLSDFVDYVAEHGGFQARVVACTEPGHRMCAEWVSSAPSGVPEAPAVPKQKCLSMYQAPGIYFAGSDDSSTRILSCELGYGHPADIYHQDRSGLRWNGWGIMSASYASEAPDDEYERWGT